MTPTVKVSLDEVRNLSYRILIQSGYNREHSEAIADMLYTCQLDDCQSHGLYRLLSCQSTMQAGKINGAAKPKVSSDESAIVKVDAQDGMSLLAFNSGLPLLVEKSKKYGLAAMAINHCFHFSALWPEVEKLSAQGLVGLSMVPSHAWVAPAGGKRGALGTNPIAFSWPRPGRPPFTFDFATSAFARGEIELYQRAQKPLPEHVAINAAGQPTTDPDEALEGAMLTFGGHKGSALAIMIELMAGPLINDLTSLGSLDFSDQIPGVAPYHGQIVLAFDPARFGYDPEDTDNDAAEHLFNEIVDQGARLPSQRRFAARATNFARGYVEIPQALYEDLKSLEG